MSVEIVRIIEVKQNNSKGYIYNNDDLKKINPEPGDIYFFVNKERGYKVWTGSSWEPTEPKSWWKRLTWRKEDNYFCDCGGPIRDYFLGYFSPYTDIKERGIPLDCDPDLKEELQGPEGGYKNTWVLLSELENIMSNEILILKNRVIKSFENSHLSQKLSRLEKILLKEDYKDQIEEPEPEDTLDYIFEEDILNLLSISDEITKISTLVSEFAGYQKKENIRINYYFI